MRGLRIGMLFMVFGITTAHAAGVDGCAAVRPAVQHLLCTHPALAAMDRTVQVLAVPSGSAPLRRRSAARRDQSLWQAERDDVLWRMMSNASYTESAVLREAWHLERSRQAFLLGRAGHGAVPYPPLTRMTRVLRAHRDAKGDPLLVWARFDRGVVLARSSGAVSNRLVNVLARVELKPDAELRRRVDEMTGGDGSLGLLWLSTARLGAVVSVQGTAHCRYLAWFHAGRDGIARVIPSPMLDQAPCGSSRPSLLQVGDTIYMALEQTSAPYAVDISVQRWLYGRWTSPMRLRLRYGHGLSVSRLRCTDGRCVRYRARLLRIARSYDMQPQGRRMMKPRLRQDERARARMLLQLARQDSKTILHTLPMAGGEPMATFCGDASLFLVRVNGRLLLGRIGHGYLGWRRSGGWRIGLWDARDGKLVPVAGAVVRRPRGRLLATAVMPPKVIATR